MIPFSVQLSCKATPLLFAVLICVALVPPALMLANSLTHARFGWLSSVNEDILHKLKQHQIFLEYSYKHAADVLADAEQKSINWLYNETVDINVTIEGRTYTPKKRIHTLADKVRYGMVLMQRKSRILRGLGVFTDVQLQEAAAHIIEAHLDPDGWDSTFEQRDYHSWFEKRQALRTAVNAVTTHYSKRAMERLMREDSKPCDRVVISMSTLPSRIAHIQPIIDSIKKQSTLPDRILIGVPPFATRLQQTYEIPAFLRDEPLIELVHLPIDFGPISKLLTALYGVTSSDTCIVTLDDDTAPAPHALEYMIQWANKLPGAAVASAGWNVTCMIGAMPFTCPISHERYMYIRPQPDYMCSPEGQKLFSDLNCYSVVDESPLGVDVLQGSSMAVYRRGMFKQDFIAMPAYLAVNKAADLMDDMRRNGTADQLLYRLADAAIANVSSNFGPEMDIISPAPTVFMIDDVYISAYLAKEGVSKFTVPMPRNESIPLMYTPSVHMQQQNEHVRLESIDALHGQANFDMFNTEAAHYFHFLGWW